jgi:hypothetical protein
VFAIATVLVLVLLAVIGLSGGDGGGGEQASTPERTRPEQRPRKPHRERRRAAPSTLRVRVVPTAPTYVCVDDGKGNVRFEGIVDGARTFRSRGRLRINLGRAATGLTVNGRRVTIPAGPAGAGFSISHSGRATPLAPAERPCV